MSEHWLRHAHGRIVAGDSEPDVLGDYGWVQITNDEREAIGNMVHLIETCHDECGKDAHHLRELLARHTDTTPGTDTTQGEGSVHGEGTALERLA